MVVQHNTAYLNQYLAKTDEVSPRRRTVRIFQCRYEPPANGGSIGFKTSHIPGTRMLTDPCKSGISSTLHSANFKRVVCPSEITAKTGCVRNDDITLASQLSGNTTEVKTSSGHMVRLVPLGVPVSAVGLAALLSI